MDHKHQPMPARGPELSEACHPVGTAEAEEIAERFYGACGSATRFETEKDDTFLLDCGDRGKFVLKIAHPSERTDELDFQVALMNRPTPITNIPRSAIFRSCLASSDSDSN